MKEESPEDHAAGVTTLDGRLLCGHCKHLCGRSESSGLAALVVISSKCSACKQINRFDLTREQAAPLSSERLAYLRERERTDYHLAETLRIMAENCRTGMETVRDFLDRRHDPRLVAV